MKLYENLCKTRYLVLKRCILVSKRGVLFQSMLSPDFIMPTRPPNKKEDLGLIVDYFVERVALEHPNREIIFVIPPPTKEIYRGEISQIIRDGHLLIQDRALSEGFHFINLTAAFQRDFNQFQMTFEADLDFHWNAYSHDLISRELRKDISRINTIQQGNY